MIVKQEQKSWLKARLHEATLNLYMHAWIFSSLKYCLPSTDAIDRQEKIHACMWRFKVISCKHAFNQLFWSCFAIIVAMHLHVYTTSTCSKLKFYWCHCKRAGREGGEFTYSKGGWVSKLLQEKIILPSYVSQHCHSIVATIKTHVYSMQSVPWKRICEENLI